MNFLRIKNWSSEFRRIGYGLFLALGLLIVWTCLSYFHLVQPIFNVQQEREIDEQVITQPLTVGTFKLPETIPQAILFEHHVGYFEFNKTYPLLIFLGVMLISMAGLFAWFTTFSSLRFFVGCALFILFLVAWQWQYLGLPIITQKIMLYSACGVFALLGFYFQSIRKHTAYGVRWMCFAVLLVLLVVLLKIGSASPAPILHLSAHLLPIGLVLTLFFIFYSAHEILAFFVRWISTGSAPNQGTHVFILCFILLGNLFITYLHMVGTLSWNWWTPPVLFLIVLSGILGIDGLKKREHLLSNILPNESNATVFYGLAFILVLSTLQVFWNYQEDVSISLINQLGIYIFLGVGVIFVLYLISNFLPLFSKNLPVADVLYQPKTMPLFTFRLASLIATFAFMVYDIPWQQIPNNVQAVYFNMKGFVSYVSHDPSASLYLSLATKHEGTNHFAYALLGAMEEKENTPKACEYWERATYYKPETATVLRLSALYQSVQKPSSSVATLKQNSNRYPDSAIPYNELGYVYAQTNQPDSAYRYFEQARQKGLGEIASANFVALSAKLHNPFPADSLYRLLKEENPSIQINAFLLANEQNIALNARPQLPNDSTLSVVQACWWGNFLFNQPKKVDTLELQTLEKLAAKLPSQAHSFFMLALAHAHFYQGNSIKSYTLMRRLARASGDEKLKRQLGLWALASHNPVLADVYFEGCKNVSDYAYCRGIARLEMDSASSAIPFWQALLASDDFKPIAEKTMRRIKSKTPLDDDEDLYFFIRYKISLWNEKEFYTLWKKIKSPDYQVNALLTLTQFYMANDLPKQAANALQLTVGLPVRDVALQQEIKLRNVRLTALLKNKNSLKLAVEKNKELLNYTDSLFYNGLLVAFQNKPTEAKQAMMRVLSRDFMDETRVATAADFLLHEAAYVEKVFSYLTEALIQNPYSVPLLKAYVKAAALRGFDGESEMALARLKKKLPPVFFNQYIDENPNLFKKF